MNPLGVVFLVMLGIAAVGYLIFFLDIISRRKERQRQAK